MSFATKAISFTAALICAGCLSASATPTTGDPTPQNESPSPGRAAGPNPRTRWLLSVPPETPVNIKSGFGKFRIPIGYLNERFSFRQNPFVPDYGPVKPDVADEQAWPSFSFNFWVPDGGMVWDSQPQLDDDRPVEPGHPKPKLQDFVVLMMSSEPAHTENLQRAAIKALPEKLGKPIGVETNNPKIFAYKGAIRSPTHDRYLRFYVECGRLDLCNGWMVIDHRDMAMHVIVPPDGITAMFDALKIADKLLDAWQIPG
jgi:hypothetical protein